MAGAKAQIIRMSSLSARLKPCPCYKAWGGHFFSKL